ncbi:protein kinase-like [Colletotrichum tofieldiae]|nr:protein kinase-like [Colletotrichum tofieldiae]
MYDQHSGIRRIDSVDAAKQIPQVPNLPPADVEFESRRKLLEQAIQPVAQRSQDRTAPPSDSRNPSLNFHSTTSTVMNEQGPAQIPLLNVGNVRRSVTPSNELRMPRALSQLQPPNSPATPRKATTVWQVRKELMKKGMGFRPSMRSLSSLFNKQPTAIKGKNISDDREQWDRRLEVEFKNRDIVYLVNNGTTMASYWSQATHLLEVLVWRSLEYDDNGMELYFTDPDTNPKATLQESHPQQLEQFTKAMKLAEPIEPKSPSHVVDTTIVPELTRIINCYTRAKTSKSSPRKKTIIVLTYGIWSGMRMEHTIDFYLRSIFHELKDLHGDLSYIQPGKVQDQMDISKIRPVTIQFVQFGDDPTAVERLRRLDDDMKLYGCP